LQFDFALWVSAPNFDPPDATRLRAGGEREGGLGTRGSDPRCVPPALSPESNDMCGLLGGGPLMLGTGIGSEIRQPLG
jgi:hypothetical protein